MRDRHEWEPIPIEEAVEMLVDAGIFTERQAEAYVAREIEQIPRQATAEKMGISVNTLDKRLGEARRKKEAAEATLEVIDELRHRPLPEECAECGDSLPGQWSTNGDREAVCLDCAGVDPEDASSREF